MDKSFNFANYEKFKLARLYANKISSSAHENFGWQEFTDATAKIVGESGAIGIFWGSKAQQFAKYFDPKLSISSVHPSPLSAYRGFFGSAPFSKTNALLRQSGKKEINW